MSSKKTGGQYNPNTMDENEQTGTVEGEASNPEESQETNLEPDAEASEQVETEGTAEGSNASESVDYESELEKERERLGKKIDKERERRIAAQKGSMPREEVEKLINEKFGEVQKQMFRSQVELLIARRAKTPAEKELVLLHYDHSIIPTGNPDEDVDMAFALANRKKVQGTISELKKTLQSKKTTLSGGSDAGQPVEQKPLVRYSKEIIEAAKFAGVTPEEFVKKQNK